MLASGWAFAQTLGAVSPASPKASGGPVVSVVRADPRSGKLVRKVVLPAGSAGTKAPVFQQTVARVAAEQSVPPELLHSVIQAESDYDPYAVSSKGALGLMQLIPSTAKRFGVADVFDPAQNIQGGARYLRYLLDLYKGDSTLALAAYSAGEGAVSRYGGVPPFPETKQYVKTVGQSYAAARSATAGTAPTGEASQPQPAKDAPRQIRPVLAPDGSVRYISE